MADAQHFADTIRGRRRELGLSLAVVAAEGGPSEPTMVRIESGHTPPLRAPTFGKLDRILRWPAGTALRVYDGQRPPTRDVDVPAPTHGYVRVPIATVAALAESVNRISDIAAGHESGPIDALATLAGDLREELTPLVGQAVAALLTDPRSDRALSARIGRVAESLLTFGGVG